MTDDANSFATLARLRLDEAVRAGAAPLHARHARAAIADLQAVLDHAAALAAELGADEHLTPAGKLDRLTRTTAHALDEAERYLERLRAFARDGRRRMTERGTRDALPAYGTFDTAVALAEDFVRHQRDALERRLAALTGEGKPT